MIKENQHMFTDKEDIKENYIVSSLVRGLKILSTFTVKRPALKVSEIAELAELDQATVFRFVYTLERLGYLVREEDTKRYRQGVRMLTLSLPAREGITVREVALQYMAELSKKTNETVKLSILDRTDVVMVAVVEVPDKLVYRTPIGHRSPVYCTAAGKAILAFQPVETWDAVIPLIDFTPRTEFTITDPQKFRECLMETREQGYATQDGEQILGLSALAAPIFDNNGKVAGGINISGLTIHFLEQGKPKGLIDELVNCAKTISEKLGYAPELFE
ncbi:MAG: IclR family transcriptional regulator [Anaerolineales bacterium]|nr:IclR family transcriptional regulator [Anaerolineales bacterium]